jgi:hypothetical protein
MQDCITTLELELTTMKTCHEKLNVDTGAGMERVHSLFVETYRDLSAKIAPFDRSGDDLGTHFLTRCKRS